MSNNDALADRKCNHTEPMEMISAKAVTFGNCKTAELARTLPSEAPVALQIFGHEPEVMAEAARRIEDWDFDILDINMGCPVPKIVNNQEGSALMKNPALIEKIVRACVRASSRPVTVKMRRGFDCNHINAVECAKAAEAGGASAIAVHGRTRTQMYSGEADRETIAEVVQAVRVPVIGNGDIKDGPSAKRMLDETGCTAVMVGRGAQGNPWVFAEIKHYLETGEEPVYKGEEQGILEMRKHVAWYVQGFPGASKIRSKVNTVTTFSELEELLSKEFPYA